MLMCRQSVRYDDERKADLTDVAAMCGLTWIECLSLVFCM